jgi:hypothetical protein
MDSTLLTAVITVSGSICAVGATYWFTKKRERDAEWRKQKLEHYKAFVVSLSGTIVGESTASGQRAFAKACNDLMLFAPQSVIEALQSFQQEIKISNPNKSDARHEQLMARLFLEMRRDLKITPADDPSTFRVGLWAAGVRPED